MKTRDLARAGIVAALYFALTVVFKPISYGPIQFRIAEILNMLAFYNPVFAPGVILGVFLSNLSSPLGWIDLLFGTLHTAISLYAMTRTKKLVMASLWPAIFSFIIGFALMLYFGGGMKGFITMTLSVMLSELVIVTFISVPIYKYLEKKTIFKKYVLP